MWQNLVLAGFQKTESRKSLPVTSNETPTYSTRISYVSVHLTGLVIPELSLGFVQLDYCMPDAIPIAQSILSKQYSMQDNFISITRMSHT